LPKKGGDKAVLALGADCKGFLGSDDRRYLLDLVRTTPRDVNFPDPVAHSTCVLRRELVTVYCRAKTVEFLLAKNKEKREKAAAAKALNGGDDVKDGEEKKDETTVAEKSDEKEGAETEETEEDGEEEKALYRAFQETLRFNPNAFTNVTLGGTPEENARDEAEVKTHTFFTLTFFFAFNSLALTLTLAHTRPRTLRCARRVCT
jgi:protein TIF31